MHTDFVQRQSLPALLLAPMSALCLHLFRMPLWMPLIFAVIFVWRWQIYRGRWPFPPRSIRYLQVFISMAAVVLYYREWYSLEPMVSLLMMAFLLKTLEVRERRDAFVLVFVGYFVAASALLFEQGIIMSLAVLLVIALLTLCLFLLNSETATLSQKRVYWRTGLMLLQAVPMAFLLMLVLPRVGALWSVPLQSASAYTGVSDSMSPGDFSQLSRSQKLAFRVSFDQGTPPPSAQRYWRGLVLTEFDGRRWRRSTQRKFNNKNVALPPFVATPGISLDYEITLEPTGKDWLYGIPLAGVQEHSLSSATVQRNLLNENILDQPVVQRLRYRVSSSLAYRVNENPETLRESLLLPRDHNPRTLKTAQEWRQQARSDRDYINRVLAFYNRSFIYTLSPPLLGEHSSDEFLFGSQRGFCEHYSSSFVILMRAAGIPARVVVGYQGGEWNEAEQYLIVRQQEAHAWAEVWLQDVGWLRVDPTAAVAPERVENNLSESLSLQDRALIAQNGLLSFDWAKRLALRWDSLNYRWQRWVLSYDSQQQSRWLEKLLGEVTALRLALLLLIPAAMLFFIMALQLFWPRRRQRSKEGELFFQLQKRLKKQGVHILAGREESISEFCLRAQQELPGQKLLLEKISHCLNSLLYNPQHTPQQVHQHQQHFYRLLKKL